MAGQTYPCEQCGAQLAFKPGTTSLVCPYCQHTTEIASSAEAIEELDFSQYLEIARLDSSKEKDQVLHCNNCAAEFTLGPHSASDSCPFCGSNVVVPTDPEVRVAPKSLIPFQIDARQARDSYRKWIASRFWAPNDLKKHAEAKSTLHGMYVPYWTYDSETTTWYTGQRGEWYYETEYYTEDGETKTREVRRTRWYPAAGTVFVPFDDVLVLATSTLPAKYTNNMQNWQLPLLTPYKDEFLSGYQAMRYDIDLENGFETAKVTMQPHIEQAIRYDIGGDEQMITTMNTQYDNITFKHVLLPIYTGAYRYSQKVWRFFINGQTGQVEGEAPISPWKVALAILLALILIGGIIYLVNSNKKSRSRASFDISYSRSI